MVGILLFGGGSMLYCFGLLGDGLLAQHLITPQTLPLFAVAVLLNSIVFGIMRSKVRRVYLAAQSLDYRMCTHCGYDLQGLPEAHSCPECGTQYSIEQTRTTWQALAKPNGPEKGFWPTWMTRRRREQPVDETRP
jgi:hypothetical protein